MSVALVRSAIVILYPRTEDLPGAADCDLDRFLAKFREETTALMWMGVVLSAIIFHVTPIFTVRRPALASSLSPELADVHAQRITTTRFYFLRQILFLVKLVAGLAWGSDPEVRRRLGLQALPPDPGTWRRV